MTGRRRTTFSVEVDAAALLSPRGVARIFTAVLTALRADARGADADLLPRHPLPPEARQAALTLQQLCSSPGRHPFDGVEVDPRDDAQWEQLLVLAPYAPRVSLRAGRWTDLFQSSGDLASVRLELLPTQATSVTTALTELSPSGLGAARLRAR